MINFIFNINNTKFVFKCETYMLVGFKEKVYEWYNAIVYIFSIQFHSSLGEIIHNETFLFKTNLHSNRLHYFDT